MAICSIQRRSFKIHLKRSLLVLLTGLLLSMPSFAQSTGLLQGTVTDAQTGQAVVRSNVILMQDGKFAGASSTNLVGVYIIDNLPAGTYDVRFARKGLDPAQNTIENVEVADGMLTTLNVALSEKGVVTDGPVMEKDARNERVIAILPPQSDEEEPDHEPEQSEPENTEQYDFFTEQGFVATTEQKQSTFGLDVDQAFYTIVRRMIRHRYIPPAGAVRIEEMLNYFPYDYSGLTENSGLKKEDDEDHALHIGSDLMMCPWNEKNVLMRIALQADNALPDHLPPSHLVLLADVSGSMDHPDKLPLVRASLRMLVDQLRPKDMVSIVQYREQASLVLGPTSAAERETIFRAIASLHPSGSTAGASGINLAYDIAGKHYLKNGNNRIIVCTDGDFNVGPQSDEEMEQLITELRKSGVFLTVLGFGSGNYKDSKLEILANKGNGQYAYVDNINAAKKSMVSELGGNLLTIGRDAKMSVKFNEDFVQQWRLIGYENRQLTPKEFRKKRTDAGEIGAGAQVTALYELIPNENKLFGAGSLATIELRYKPAGRETPLVQREKVDARVLTTAEAGPDFIFASAVAGFGLILSDSRYKGTASPEQVLLLAAAGLGNDASGYRSDFQKMVRDYMDLIQPGAGK